MFIYLSILKSQTVCKVVIITVLFSGKETEVQGGKSSRPEAVGK